MFKQRENKIDTTQIAAPAPFIAEIYARRINAANEMNLHWKFLLPPTLKGIEAAVDRIIVALENQERIVIYGDYDVDGACATALMMRVLKHVGANVTYFLPHRRKHGYGLNPRGLQALLEVENPQLIITVDNGISAINEAQTLKTMGIDLIITDHHLPAAQIPEAVAVINPQLDNFPSKALCGAGVAFYVLWALQERLQLTSFKVSQFWDLVAVATISDIVPMDYNNRILTYYGLRQLNLGLSALCAVNEIENPTASDVAFYIAPNLNAAGRLENMTLGVELLLCDDYNQALDKARYLYQLNQRRKALEAEMCACFIDGDEKVSVVYQGHWHEGVIGIAAAKIKGKTQKPTLVACDSEDDWIKGSMRAPSGVHLKALLDKVAPLLPHDVLVYGGHASAAGLSIKKEYFNQLIQLLNKNVEPYEPEFIEHDGEIPSAYFNLETAQYLENLEPWCSMFPAPLFLHEFELISWQPMGKEKNHARIILRHLKDNKEFTAVWFFNLPTFKRAKVAFNLSVNRFNNRESLQLQIIAVEPL